MHKISICIPTYNRAMFLKRTLESICEQVEFSKFSNDIEIVISDNCSLDETQSVCAEFVKKYPNQIKYYRNEENIIDRNFEAALRLASGDLRKLSNDTLLFLPGSLRYLLDLYASESKNRKIIFFKNDGTSSDLIGAGLNSFVYECSFNCTWIGGFSIWADHLSQMNDFSRSSNKLLTQVDVLFRLINEYDHYKIIGRSLFSSVPVRNKTGYSYAKVFLGNYFDILKEFNVDGSIVVKERKAVLIKHVLRHHAGVLVGFGPQHNMSEVYSYLAKFVIKNPILVTFYVVKLFFYAMKFSIDKLRYGEMGR